MNIMKCLLKPGGRGVLGYSQSSMYHLTGSLFWDSGSQGINDEDISLNRVCFKIKCTKSDY